LGRGYGASHGYTSRKAGRALIRGSYKLQHGKGGNGGAGNMKSLVAKDEAVFKTF